MNVNKNNKLKIIVFAVAVVFVVVMGLVFYKQDDVYVGAGGISQQLLELKQEINDIKKVGVTDWISDIRTYDEAIKKHNYLVELIERADKIRNLSALNEQITIDRIIDEIRGFRDTARYLYTEGYPSEKIINDLIHSNSTIQGLTKTASKDICKAKKSTLPKLETGVENWDKNISSIKKEIKKLQQEFNLVEKRFGRGGENWQNIQLNLHKMKEKLWRTKLEKLRWQAGLRAVEDIILELKAVRGVALNCGIPLGAFLRETKEEGPTLVGMCFRKGKGLFKFCLRAGPFATLSLLPVCYNIQSDSPQTQLVLTLALIKDLLRGGPPTSIAEKLYIGMDAPSLDYLIPQLIGVRLLLSLAVEEAEREGDYKRARTLRGLQLTLGNLLKMDGLAEFYDYGEGSSYSTKELFDIGELFQKDSAKGLPEIRGIKSAY